MSIVQGARPSPEVISKHQSKSRLGSLVWFAMAVLVLCAAAVVNGQPFFYPDTTAYVRGAEMGLTKVLGERFRTDLLPPEAVHAPIEPQADPQFSAALPKTLGSADRKARGLTSIEDKIVLAGRSVYYGALLYVAYVTSEFWLAVVLQAMAVAYLLHLLIVRLWGLGGPVLLGTLTALVLLTPVSGFTGLLMPDIFAPLVILSMAILGLYWRELGRGDRVAIGLILVAGLVSHASHIALAAALWVVLLSARLAGSTKWRASTGALAIAAVCIGGALAAEWTFNKAVTVVLGEAPLRLPYLTARLVDTGPGTAYLQATCPASGYSACAYVHNFPTKWDLFMFSIDPSKGAFALASANEKRKFSAEQIRFFFDVFRYDPLGVLRTMGAGAIGQLASFGVHVIRYSPENMVGYEARLPTDVFARMQRARIAGHPAWSEAMTALTYLTVIVAMVAGAFLLWRGRLDAVEQTTRLRSFALLVITGVVANALICGVLASPYDRFQARVIWLVPLVAIVGWVSWRRAINPETSQKESHR